MTHAITSRYYIFCEQALKRGHVVVIAGLLELELKLFAPGACGDRCLGPRVLPYPKLWLENSVLTTNVVVLIENEHYYLSFRHTKVVNEKKCR